MRSFPLWSRNVRPLLLTIALCSPACGGGTPESRTADSEDGSNDSTTERKSELSTSSEIGALDPDKVTATFEDAMGELQECLKDGADRVEYLGGKIGFFLKIDSAGRIAHAHAEESTLGDRKTEKCMLGALKRHDWPRPQGGDVGLARNSFDFDMLNDVRPPTEWSEDRVSEVVGELSEKIRECKDGASGDFTATIYVDEEGAALAAGIAASDESGETAADCLTDLLKSAKYPSPGSWPAKVTFTL